MSSSMDRQLQIGAPADESDELAPFLAAIDRGERNALRKLYERTAAKLYGICLRVLADEADAQEVVQEVFTTVWTKAGRYDPARARAMTWLSVLARNKAIDRLRSRRESGASLDEAPELASGDASQLEVLEQREDAERLNDCLDSLDERARVMIRSAFFEGASYPELARREDVPLPTMKSWIRRGLLRLKGCLEQ
jgi:RNA polymerase sigma-70 factor (ECF subfamily)